MIVLAHVRSQSCALIDTNLVGAGGVSQDDEGIKRYRPFDSARGSIGTPPIIGRIDRCTSSSSSEVQIASIGRTVARQAAEIQVDNQIIAGTDINATSARIGSGTTGSRVSSNCYFGNVESLTHGVVPESTTVSTQSSATSSRASLVIGYDCAGIHNQTCRSFDSSSIARRLVSRDRAGMQSRPKSRARPAKSENAAASACCGRSLRSLVVEYFRIVQDNSCRRPNKNATASGAGCRSHRSIILNRTVYKMSKTRATIGVKDRNAATITVGRNIVCDQAISHGEVSVASAGNRAARVVIEPASKPILKAAKGAAIMPKPNHEVGDTDSRVGKRRNVLVEGKYLIHAGVAGRVRGRIARLNDGGWVAATIHCAGNID